MNELMSEKIDLLATALSKTQLAIENVSKDKQAYGYKYADLASCLQAVKKPLSDNGLSISQLVTLEENKQVLVTLLMHESGQWLKSVFCIENVVMKQCNSLQQIGAGLTYARRYALSAIVGLTQEDDDGSSVPKFAKNENSNSSMGEEIKQGKVKELIDLCNKEGINIKEFTKTYGINSNDIAGLDKAISNFESLKEEFVKK